MKKGLATGKKVPKIFEELVEPHVASFDYFLSDGIQKVVQHIEPVEVWSVNAIRKGNWC